MMTDCGRWQLPRQVRKRSVWSCTSNGNPLACCPAKDYPYKIHTTHTQRGCWRRETKSDPRPKKSKGTWYVLFWSSKRAGKRAQPRVTEVFQNEQDAKAFARAKLAEALNVTGGTLNPHQPKRIIASAQILDWLNEPNDQNSPSPPFG